MILLNLRLTYFLFVPYNWCKVKKMLNQFHNNAIFFFRNEEAKAARLAREIESNPSSQNRANLENGDEEER